MPATDQETGLKQCAKCERHLPADIEHYHRHRQKSDGLRPRCKECRGSSFGAHKPNVVYDTDDGEKVCTKCRRTLPADSHHFYSTDKTDDRLVTSCKECRGGSFGIHHTNRVAARDGQKYCHQCERWLPDDDQHFHKQTSQCKECRGVGFGVHRINRVRNAPEGHIYCASCREPIPLESARGDSYCPGCHQDMWAEYRLKRKSREESTLQDFSEADWQRCKQFWSEDNVLRCAYCGQPDEHMHMDHFVPVSQGGPTTTDNIVPACSSCNPSKSDGNFFAWYPRQDFYSEEREQAILDYLYGGEADTGQMRLWQL